MDVDYKKYSVLKRQGLSPSEVYLSAKADGKDLPYCIRMLRSLFGFDLVKAKEVTIVSDTQFESLAEYQRSLIPELEELFKTIEEDDYS